MKKNIFYRQVIVDSLHPGGVYTQVALVRLVGIMLLVYALETHMPFIENVSTDTVGTGIMGKLVREFLYLYILINDDIYIYTFFFNII